MKKIILSIGLLLTFSLCVSAQIISPSLVNLRTEYLKNPIGIDTKKPKFSWEMSTNQRGSKQSAYEITVSTSQSGDNPIWNSGKVVSDKSVNIIYAGAALSPSTRYYWHVNSWDNNSVKMTSTETSFFETGLMDTGWGSAKWIKASNLKQGQSSANEITDYSISLDFQLNDIAAGPCFSAKDANNFFMWQINIETGRVRFRPHSWLNGSAVCHENKDISSLINIQKGTTYTLRIDIKGDKATTYINNILIDADRVNPRGGNYGYGNLGFRSAMAETSSTLESAYYDNIKVTTIESAIEKTLFSENFSNATNFAFTGGTVVGGRLLINTSMVSLQRVTDATPTKFTLETDMTLLNQNAGILFAAKDMNNMYMWSINTKDQAYPFIRRHIYVANTPVTSEVSIAAFYSKSDLIGKERHVKIDVDNNVIKTYIDAILVDTYINTSSTLTNGFVGFRAYNGDNSTDEIALYDNITLTNYLPNATTGVIEPVIAFSENFQNGTNPFEDADTTSVLGNVKLKMIAKSSDLRVLNGGKTGIPMFRTKFSLNNEIQSAKLYTSALGVYDVFINGKRVGTTSNNGKVIYDELKPGWTDFRKTVQYSSYDVTELLKTGANAVGAQVASGYWNGGISHGDYGNLPLAFIAKLVVIYTNGTTEVIVSDPSWLTSTNGPVRMADIYNGETYDARKETTWTTADFADADWLQTTASNDFKGEIKAFVGIPVRVRPELEISPKTSTVYEGTKASGTTYGAISVVSTDKGAHLVQLKKGQTVIFDMGQNMAGWVKFTAKAAAGAKMKIRFGEMLNDNGASSRGNDGPAGSLYTANLRSAKASINYTFKGSEAGESYNPSLTYFGFRYCEVTANQDVEIQSLIAEVVGSATVEQSSFTTSNAMVNKLYSNIIWGQRSNFVSIPTDCPQRDERLGWTGDTQIFSRAAAYNADVASFFHKWMGDMRDSQRSDGAYPSVAPFTWGVGYGRGAWADAGVIVPWNIYLMYDDKDIIAENYASMEKYMDFLVTQAGGGYLYNGGVDEYGDWLSYEGLENRYVSVCYYAYDAMLMSKMSKALSKAEGDIYDLNSTKYNTLYKNIRTEFQSRYVYPNGTLKQSSQTAYLLALKLDLFTSVSTKDLALKYLTQKIATNGNKLSTGFLGTGILNQTLSEMGETNTAYNLLLQRSNPSWLYSIDQGATTIWERWNSYTIETGFGDVSMNSFNHYSYGAVAEWMYRFIAGIETDETTPGFKHFVLQPNPDNRVTIPQGQERITSVDAKFNSYYGDIKSSWIIRTDGNLRYTATIPSNTTATLYLPLANATDIIYEGDILAENAEGVNFVKKENGKAVYELKSGTFTFSVNVPASTGFKDLQEKKKFTVYPNPVHSKLNIAIEPVNYIITDISGNKLKSGNGKNVNVTELKSGVYFLKTENQISKFIKD